MRKAKSLFLATIFLSTIFVSVEADNQKSLADLYRSGRVRFIPELTIDDTSMPEDTFIESAFDIVCDEDGYVYICDYRAHNIKKFDSSGKYVKTIGRKGQGPGEFNMPFEVAVTKDRLIVWDMGNRRLCALTPDGEFIKSVTLVRGEGRPQKMRSLPNGDIVIELEKVYFGEQNRPQDYMINVYSPDLEHKKTVYTQQILRNKFMRLKGMTTNIIQPFAPLVFWDVRPDGKIVIAHSIKYEIGIYDADKGKISSFTHSYEPVKVTDKDKKTFFAGMTYSSDGVVKQGAPDFIVRNTEFPKSKPPFKQILVDSEGNILVWPYRKKRDEESKFFDAFDPQGNFLGDVQIIGEGTFPARVIIKDGSFWLQRTDEDELIKVIRYRISD